MEGTKKASGGVKFNDRSDIIKFYNEILDLVEKNGDGRHVINLPRIAVIGSQSSGKSSVLESLAGISFLPKGSGVVTRRPIILRLINILEGNPWIEFEHLPNEKFEDFAKVEEEIVRDTKKVAGQGSDISDIPIKITVYSPDVLSFTVIDLPGIVKNADDQQAENIEDQINKLIMSYISDQNTIILAVAKGNDDLVNAESIKMAREVDPNQSRTLVVVTKLDLAEDTETMLETLEGKIKKNKLGIVGVINRSKDDLLANKPFAQVLDSENKFLWDNYPDIAKNHGIPVLSQKLHKILSKRIAACCPNLFIQVGDQQRRSEAELKALGESCDLSDDAKQEILSEYIEMFSDNYKAQVWGQGVNNMKEGEITRGRIIDKILSTQLSQGLKALNPFKGLSDEKLLIAVSNALPVGHKMITPEIALNYFIRKAIGQAEPIAFNVVELIYEQMQVMIDICLEECDRFPKLNSAIRQVTFKLIEERMVSTRQVLKDYFEVQSCSSWTANEEFENLFVDKMKPLTVVNTGKLSMKFLQENGGENIKDYLETEELIPFQNPLNDDTLPFPLQEEGSQDQLSDEQKNIIKELRDLVEHMFEIVRWQVQDFIAKAILTRQIDQTVKGVAVNLHKQLNKPQKINEIVQEGESVQERREILKKEIEYQKQALALLNKVKDEAM